MKKMKKSRNNLVTPRVCVRITQDSVALDELSAKHDFRRYTYMYIVLVPDSATYIDAGAKVALDFYM